MSKSFRVVGCGEVRGDCSAEYKIEVTKGATVSEVISDILSDTREWGYIGIRSTTEVFGEHNFEYRYGKILSNKEGSFWKRIADRKVKAIKGEGGWSRSDYQFVLEEEYESNRK